jgi:hypothetical protein
MCFFRTLSRHVSVPLFRMAVEFAVQCRAKHLVLFHLSPRYRPIKVKGFVIQVIYTKCGTKFGKKISVVDRQRFDADPTLDFGADPDPDPNLTLKLGPVNN